MAPKNSWKLDRRLTAMMVEDMLFDPVLAAKVLLRVKIPPHEELRLFWMWTTYYTNDDSGFSTGKSYTFALVSALRSILIPGRVSGILSKTFAQGKLIFKNFDKWYDLNPIFRSCIKHSMGKSRLVHGNEAYTASFRGGSEIRVLPPAFMQDSERLRSERWHDGYFDEWTTYGNFNAFNKTIVGRVSNINDYKNCPVRQNHLHLASTPNFMHHPSYEMIKMTQHQVAQGNADYGLFSCNYRHIPDNQKWEWMVNRKTIFHMQCTLPPGMVKSEVDGLWQQDSGSFYSSKLVDDVRYNSILPILKRLNVHSGDVFVAGCDVARGGSDVKTEGSGDDFAISLFRIPRGTGKPQHCLTIRRNKIKVNQMAGIIHEIHRHIGLSALVYDPGGGGLFLKDELLKDECVINGMIEKVVPIIEFTDISGVIGDRILIAHRRRDFWINRKYQTMASDSVLINRTHNEMKEALSSGNVMLYGTWDGWGGDEKAWDVDAKREFLNRVGPTLDPIERNKADMDLAVSQLILVDVERDDNGVPVLDSHNMFKFGSKSKKDAAYSLIYGHLGCTLYRFMQEAGLGLTNREQSNVVCVAAPV